jgi:hypothetical protein
MDGTELTGIEKRAARTRVHLHQATYVSGPIDLYTLFQRASSDLKYAVLDVGNWLRGRLFFQIIGTHESRLVVRELAHEHSDCLLTVEYQDLIDLVNAGADVLNVHVYCPGSPKMNVHFENGVPGSALDAEARLQQASTDAVFEPFRVRMQGGGRYAEACTETHGSVFNCTRLREQRDPVRGLLEAKLRMVEAITQYAARMHCVPGNTADAGKFNWEDQHTTPESLKSILRATEDHMGRTLHEEFKWAWEKNVQGTGYAKAPDDVLEGVALDAETAHTHGPFFYRDGASLADRPEFLSRAQLLAHSDAKRASETPDEHAARKCAKVTTGA